MQCDIKPKLFPLRSRRFLTCSFKLPRSRLDRKICFIPRTGKQWDKIFTDHKSSGLGSFSPFQHAKLTSFGTVKSVMNIFRGPAVAVVLGQKVALIVVCYLGLFSIFPPFHAVPESL